MERVIPSKIEIKKNNISNRSCKKALNSIASTLPGLFTWFTITSAPQELGNSFNTSPNHFPSSGFNKKLKYPPIAAYMIATKGITAIKAIPFPISRPRAVFINTDLINMALTVPIQEAEVETSITIVRITIV